MKILGIIPARGGSKGVPGKNIKMLGDKPLLAYSGEAASQAAFLTKTILSSDNGAIQAVAIEYGLEVPFTRPETLATDTASSIDVVKHAVEYLERQGEYFDAVCLLQPTSPFREQGFIDKAIQKFIVDGTDALVSVLPVPHEYNPHWVFEVDNKGLLRIATGEKEIIKRRQELPQAYFRDGSLYITKVSVIKQGSFYGEKLSYIESNPDFYVNIDTFQDWIKAEENLKLIKDRL
ncbi:cytidylyltransferase domain-containing protein [Flavobacterium sp. H122]|uniref:acylneuraminate cytidylyltransferase family protein n=1 Tax=Flavobacterium sp. H122 TaxID=2529860 RepID=UPI0010A9CD85|nr:acylneuraminate cytidylyltransferase family protein [Flavobacterium sp. H122]